MEEIVVDVWLYGDLAKYAGDAAKLSYANLRVPLPIGGTIAMLLERVSVPTGERGITFINGDLSAMTGLQPDLPHVLNDGDRVAFFDLHSMWPFQYRHGVAMIPEMSEAIKTSEDGGIHHSYKP
jgi:hypothetical protein